MGSGIIVIQGNNYTNVRLSHNVFRNSYSSLAYFEGVDTIEIKHNVFDTIGRRWDQEHTSTVAPRALYFKYNTYNVEVTDNLFYNLAADSMNLRNGGIIDSNVLFT